jgi:hypothetical protein
MLAFRSVIGCKEGIIYAGFFRSERGRNAHRATAWIMKAEDPQTWVSLSGKDDEGALRLLTGTNREGGLAYDGRSHLPPR